MRLHLLVFGDAGDEDGGLGRGEGDGGEGAGV
jgi:hypothetical protein